MIPPRSRDRRLRFLVATERSFTRTDSSCAQARIAPVVGQAWRGRGPRQALLAKALAAVEVHPLDEALGRAAGELLAVIHRADAIDAAIVLLANDGDQIVTSDPQDLEPLAAATGRHVEIIPS